MRSVTAFEFQRNIAQVQDLALKEPVSITHHGRPRTVLMSIDEYNRLKSRDKQSSPIEELPEDLVSQIAGSEMDPSLAHLDKELE